MEDKEVIKKYINNFRQHLTPHLKRGISVKSMIHPSTDSGAVLEFSLGKNIESEDDYKPATTSVNASLDTVDQHAFGGNLFAFKFSGTSTVLEPGRIIIVKGEDNLDEWSDKAARDDVQKVITSSIRD